MSRKYKPIDDRESDRLQEILDRIPMSGHAAAHAVLLEGVVTLEEFLYALRTRSLDWGLDLSIEPSRYRFKRGIGFGHVFSALFIAFSVSLAITGLLRWGGSLFSGDPKEALDGMILTGGATIAAIGPWMLFFRPYQYVAKILKWQSDGTGKESPTS